MLIVIVQKCSRRWRFCCRCCYCHVVV